MRFFIRIVIILIFLLMASLTLVGCVEARSKEYVVSFVTNGGKAMESIVTSEISEEPQCEERDSFRFMGWYHREDLTIKAVFPMQVTRETILYAAWERLYSINYTTIVVDDNGQPVSNKVKGWYSDEYLDGEEIQAREAPVDEGYEFLGWQTEIPETMYVSFEPIIIVGWFKAKQYKICFDIELDSNEEEDKIEIFNANDRHTTVYKGVTREFPAITVTYGQEYLALLKNVKVVSELYDFDVWTYTNENYQRVDYKVVEGETWKFARNLLLTPKWVVLGSAGLDYILNEEGNGYLVTFDKRSNQRVIVPETHEGLPIVGVADDAFANATAVNEIILPKTNSFKTIGARAFLNCANLTKINIPPMATIGNSAFRSCISLTSIDIPAYLKNIPDYAFAMCSSLVTVNFSSSSILESIGSYAFSGAAQLKTIKFPATLRRIGNFAFESCSSLESIQDFDKNTLIETIGVETFSGCTSITILALPSKLTSINAGAFKGCTSLRTIGIPQTLRFIDTGAFQDCTNLNTIVLHLNITTIKAKAFYGCLNLPAIRIEKSINDPIPSGWEENWDLKEDGVKHDII